jgi:hypothetical protein
MRLMTLLGACGLALAAATATAEQPPPGTAATERPLLFAAAGTFALVEQYDYPVMLGVHYRGRPRTAWQLRPGAGVDAGPDGMLFTYLDMARDFPLPRRWLLTLSLAGGWFENGAPIGAGHELEFKSGLAVGRRLDSGGLVGLAGYHVSNAGLDSPNNGSEALVLFLAMPLRR